MSYKTGNVLVLGDLHIPAERSDYLDFCLDVRKKYKCDKVVQIGDMFDNHNMSYHESENDAPSVSSEVELAREHIKPWKKAFRKMRICIGNHDALIYRKAKTHGFSNHYIKTWNQIFDLPSSWEWGQQHYYKDVMFMHGTGFSGKTPHTKAMTSHRQNVCLGHCHSIAGVEYSACQKDILWGMAVGCGVDKDHMFARYGQHYASKPILSCGVILEGGKLPLVVNMEV